MLLTDGANTVGDQIAAANAAKAAGTRIIAIGLGEANNTQMLSVVSSPNDYYYAPSSDDLSGLYTSIAGELCRDPNQTPTVGAGPDQTITLPATATLAGTATDDGLPTGATLTTTWSKVSGPGTVTFANPAALTTTATFSEPGAYVLRLTADDSELTASDDLTIAVNPDLTITLPASATANGTATDDGLPQGSTLSVSWTKVSGPGTVTFAPASSAQTTATFDAPGTYVLRITGTDSDLSASDDVTVTVQPAPRPPVAAFTVAGVPMHVAATVFASSGSVGGLVPPTCWTTARKRSGIRLRLLTSS